MARAIDFMIGARSVPDEHPPVDASASLCRPVTSPLPMDSFFGDEKNRDDSARSAGSFSVDGMTLPPGMPDPSKALGEIQKSKAFTTNAEVESDRDTKLDDRIARAKGWKTHINVFNDLSIAKEAEAFAMLIDLFKNPRRYDETVPIAIPVRINLLTPDKGGGKWTAYTEYRMEII